MTEPANPFEFGRELSPDELVDREAELAAVTNTIARHGKLFLIGPRRYGKTSILRVASTLAERDGACVFRYDAQAFPTVTELAERLAADTVQRLTSSVERAGKAVLDFFSTVRPTASFDPHEGKWSLSLAGATSRTGGGVLLADVLDGLERAAAKSKRRVAVIIDEFQEVIERGGDTAEEQIRSAIQRHTHVGYVFAGSRTRLLADMVSDASRPFYRLGSVHFLGPIPRADFTAFLSAAFKRTGLTITRDGVDALLDLAADVPYNVQALASACWNSAMLAMPRKRGQARPPIDAAFVAMIMEGEARRLDPLYMQIWTGLTAPQRQALIAVIREKGQRLLATTVGMKYRLPIPTMQRSLAALEKKLIIREDTLAGSVSYRLEDPLFQRWIIFAIAR